jgi:hypothetical protein
MQLVEQQMPQAAFMYSSKADEQQASEQKVQEQKPVAEQAAAAASATVAAPAASTAATPATTSKSKAEEEWTEVVDEKSGQTYYWNEKTGEVVNLQGWVAAAADVIQGFPAAKQWSCRDRCLDSRCTHVLLDIGAACPCTFCPGQQACLGVQQDLFLAGEGGSWHPA